MDISNLPAVAGIYVILNNENGKVYVGSSNNILRRCRAHISQLRRRKHANEYLQRAWDLHGADEFACRVAELVSDLSLLAEVEQKHIDLLRAAHRDAGYNIIPTAAVFTHTEETKRKIGDSWRGRRHTLETRALLSEIARSRSDEAVDKLTAALKKKSPEHIAKIAAHHRGKEISVEQRKKQSAATKGRKQSPEHVAARAESLRGKPKSQAHREALSRVHSGSKRGELSMEHKEKIASALRGRIVSAETRAKISSSKKGKKIALRSQEHCKAISDAKRARNAARKAGSM